MGAVVDQRLAKAIEHLNRQPSRVLLGLDHDRWHRTDQYRLGDAAGAMPGDVTRHFDTAGGVSDMHRVLQVEVLRERGHVGGISIHLITGVCLG
ncbi:hypothetical protein D3C78_1248390 [compost metagenome]